MDIEAYIIFNIRNKINYIKLNWGRNTIIKTSKNLKKKVSLNKYLNKNFFKLDSFSETFLPSTYTLLYFLWTFSINSLFFF